MFAANNVRSSISKAISEAEFYMGNSAYDIVLAYKQLAVDVQLATETAISAQNSKIKIYTVPSKMSLRMVAFKNGLSYDRQNDIANLNPFLGSVNLVQKGTILTVPTV